ncbi:MAG TPA: hypothetical protein PKD63_02010 [Solirubrobacteraceae bacterium]|nr:hypothetical protein [Solirubrobacteraceae bacterium]
MTTLRNIWSDLVEKRLWPVAVLLAAGLLAVPVVLAKGGDEAVPTPTSGAVLASATVEDETEIVTLDVAPGVRRHAGRGQDPFVQPKGSTPEKAQALESGTADEGGGGGGGGGGGDAAPAPADDAPAKDETKSSKPKSTAPTYTVTLRFGQADSMKTLRNVARLTPLPSAQSPFFVYLGAKKDGKTLVFLVSSDAKATGDGTCRPSAKDCETIELQSGDTEFFDLTTTDGVQQYQMDIVKITKSGSTSSSSSGKAAKSARARASKSDRRLLRKVLAGRADHLMGAYRWDSRRGVLVHVPAWEDDRPSRTTGAPEDAAPFTGIAAD